MVSFNSHGIAQIRRKDDYSTINPTKAWVHYATDDSWFTKALSGRLRYRSGKPGDQNLGTSTELHGSTGIHRHIDRHRLTVPIAHPEWAIPHHHDRA